MRVDEAALYSLIGEKLKTRRVELKLTQDQLSDRVGVSRTSITNIEAGVQKLPLYMLYHICSVLDLEVVTLLPPVSEIVQRDGDEEVEVNNLSPRTASFVREALESLSKDET